MYFEHYHLTKKPFGLTPGPDFFWLSEKHKEALATLRYGVLADLGFLLLTGEVGVGKTALIHRLLSSLDSSTIVAHITDPGLGINDFFRLLAVEFGIDTPFNSKGEFLIILERFLRQADKDNKKVLLIVDEAQRVNSVLLDQIRVLSNIELNDRKLINIFFIGQPEFKQTLLESVNRPIRQRIAIYYHVQPLTEAETGEYIEHRLAIAGAKRKIFKPDAIAEIHRVAQGYPRAINILCDHALLTGYATGAKTIDSAIIRECEKDLNIETEGSASVTKPTSLPKFSFSARSTADGSDAPPIPARPSKTWAYPAVIAAGITLVAVAGYFLLWTGPSGPPTTQEAAGPASGAQAEVSTDGGASSTESPTSDKTVLAMNDTSKATASASPSGQTNSTPTAAEKVRPLSIPAPPPFTTEPNVETAPADSQPPMGNMSSTSAIAHAANENDQALSTQTDSPRADGKPPTPATTTESPAAASTPDATPEAQQEQEIAVAAVEAPAGATVARPDESPSAPTEAEPEPSASSAKKTVEASSTSPQAPPRADQPPPVNAAPTETDSGTSRSRPAATTSPAPTPMQKVGDLTPSRSKPEKPLPVAPTGPAMPATAALTPQATQRPPTAEGKPAVNAAMENRLRSFLQDYCNTYSAKDLDSFTRFFASDAVENGKPFKNLLPKYQKNFTFIDTIYYRIELQQVVPEEEGEMLKIDGDFFLRWLPPDKKWRENAGKIYMTLKNNGSSFLVHRLEYHSNRSTQD